MLGCIGNDNYGTKIAEELEKSKVKTVLEKNEKLQSSRCAVGVHLKERCLVPQIRASSQLSMDYVKEKMVTILF